MNAKTKARNAFLYRPWIATDAAKRRENFFMRVLYIDVYFLINFTVDLLSLYFSLAMLHFSPVRWRLVLSSLIGATYASLSVLLHTSTALLLILSLVSLIGMILLISPGVGMYRRMKLSFLFLFLQLLIGGIVHFGYDLLRRLLSNVGLSGSVENRKLLYLAALILLALGILRLAMALLSGASGEESLEIGITVMGRRYYGSALVDSGCFLCDPLDGTAVVLIKRGVAERLLPDEFLFENMSSIPEEYKKKLRLIPIRVFGAQRILTGIRPDDFYICKNSKKERVRVVLAYDKEDGDYEGYKVLIPSAIAKNV